MDTELEQQEEAILTTIRNHDDAERARIHAAPVPSEQVERDIGVEVATAISDRNFEVFQQQLHARASEQEVTPEHSPLPWIVGDGGNGKNGVWNRSRQVAVCNQGNCKSDEPEANAAFIVAACNSHAELKERVMYLSDTNAQLATDFRSLRDVLGSVVADLASGQPAENILDYARAALSKGDSK